MIRLLLFVVLVAGVRADSWLADGRAVATDRPVYGFSTARQGSGPLPFGQMSSPIYVDNIPAGVQEISLVGITWTATNASFAGSAVPTGISLRVMEGWVGSNDAASTNEFPLPTNYLGSAKAADFFGNKEGHPLWTFSNLQNAATYDLPILRFYNGTGANLTNFGAIVKLRYPLPR